MMPKHALKAAGSGRSRTKSKEPTLKDLQADLQTLRKEMVQLRKRLPKPKEPQPALTPEEVVQEKEIDAILARLEVGIAEQNKKMDELLTQLRATRITQLEARVEQLEQTRLPPPARSDEMADEMAEE
jgi:predicted  nucleic acid-binding Zn-ribbon protein